MSKKLFLLPVQGSMRLYHGLVVWGSPVGFLWDLVRHCLQLSSPHRSSQFWSTWHMFSIRSRHRGKQECYITQSKSSSRPGCGRWRWARDCSHIICPLGSLDVTRAIMLKIPYLSIQKQMQSFVHLLIYVLKYLQGKIY